LKNKDSQSLQKKLAYNVRFFRKKMGISQEKLAELSGYHRTYIGSIERGERNITLETIESLSFIFGIEPYKLLVSDQNG